MFVNAIAVIADMGRERGTGSFSCSKSYTRALLYQYEYLRNNAMMFHNMIGIVSVRY